MKDLYATNKMAQELLESEERFRATFEQAAVGIAHVAPDGHWLLVNQRLCDIVGYSRAELLELTFQDITYADDLESDLTYVQQMLLNQLQSYSMEKRYIRKDGSLVWINLTVSLVRDKGGSPKYFISVVEDISIRKQAENQIRDLSRLPAESPRAFQRLIFKGSMRFQTC
jgi:PAS domain S-box-containing protein